MLNDKISYISSVDILLQNVLTSLQERVLSFIKLLHDSELERKKLRTKVLSLTDSEQALRKSEHFAEQLELELAVLKNQVVVHTTSQSSIIMVNGIHETIAF